MPAVEAGCPMGIPTLGRLDLSGSMLPLSSPTLHLEGAAATSAPVIVTLLREGVHTWCSLVTACPTSGLVTTWAGMLMPLRALRYIAGDPCSPGSSSSSDQTMVVPVMGSKCSLLAARALNCSWSITSGSTSARSYNTLQDSNCSATSTGRHGFVHRRWSESRVLLCNTRARVSVGIGTPCSPLVHCRRVL